MNSKQDFRPVWYEAEICAAEACTELGADDDRPDQGSGVLLWPLAVMLVAAGAAVVIWWLR